MRRNLFSVRSPVLCWALPLLLVTQISPPALGAQDVKTQINALPAGADIEVHLKTKETLRGAKGDVTDSGFTLLLPAPRQLAYDDIASVKPVNAPHKSHKTRNILIIVAVAVAVVVGVIAIYAKECPLGCGSHTL